MICAYHDNKEAIKSCINCHKSICNDCYHTSYSDYCWSCGLDYDNGLEEAGKIFHFPKIFENRYIFYIINKLFLTFGSCLLFTVIICLIFGANEFTSVLLFVWVITAMIVYTYGFFVALVIDFATRFIPWVRIWYINLGVFLIFGFSFPLIIELNYRFNPIFISIIGGVVSLIYFGLSKVRFGKDLVIFIGLCSLFPVTLLTIMTVLKGLS